MFYVLPGAIWPHFLQSMAKRSKLEWFGIAAIAYFAFKYASEAVFARIFVGSPSIQLGRISATGIEATLKVPITNNTPLPLPLEALQATVKYGGNPLTTVNLYEGIEIAPNGTTELSFTAILNFSELGQSVANLIESRSWLQALTFEGIATSQGVVFPFTQTFRVGV